MTVIYLNKKCKVNISSSKYYTDILEMVKSADSIKLNSLSLMDKFTVLTIRHVAKADEILAMGGKELFVYSVKKGMVGKDGVTSCYSVYS